VLNTKEDEMDKACRIHTGEANAYKVFFGKPEGNALLEKQRRRSDDIKWVLETGLDGLDSIYLGHSCKQAMKLQFPKNIQIPGVTE
jgi:hypothetical protein